MTQWCATAAGLFAALALVAAARYRAVSATQRRRNNRQQRELARLRDQLDAELARRGSELAAVQQEQELNASTQRAFLSVARRILVMAHDQQALLDEMERTHDDPALLEGLLKADHAAAQQARLAQTLAVLCGARAGRHWPEPVSLEDVVRGAQSRILPFQRVVVRSRIETAVVGAAAEALIHAVAELLDNATRYSPPSTQVFVTLMPVHNGAVVEIDDGGVGMPEQAVAKAASALAGGSALEVSRLGEVPQLGLAAVGRLAEQYGFRVTLSSAPSPYGGVRVVVLLPNALLTEPLPPTVPGLGLDDPAFTPLPHRAAGPLHPAAPATGHLPGSGYPPDAGHPLVETPPTDRPPAAGPAAPPPLPRRSHRRDRTHRRTAPAATTPAPPLHRSAQDAQAFMAMFQAGTANGRSAARARAQIRTRAQAQVPAHHDPSQPASPQLPQRSGEFHDHHP
ncbi:sensor histidine kinase [Kitasatospora sp. NPDC047058]|uniref:sensor histidine kinase n=1 Tax=Kitasatospora sp. NPDC047058 TaxID=3155620 RepID=UPI0033EDF171